jgi:epoxyqueuosine reductase
MTTVPDHFQLKARLRQRALELGIDRIGFCTAAPFPDQQAQLEIARTEQRTCGLEPAELASPASLLPDARSFIVIAVNYFQPLPAPPPAPFGTVSRSALGPDYHGWLNSLLNALAKPLDDRGAHWRCGTDNWPFPDRELARRAGLGHIGKNSSLIVPGLGSWVFIGAILCDVDLPPDAPLTGDPCGDCNRCRCACPTGAIIAPRQINARCCISFLTQCKQPIPLGLRQKTGQAIYGCDRCQEACPLNQDAPSRASAREETLPPFPLLESIFRLERSRMPKACTESAAFWRGLHVLRRNALIAAVNTAPKLAKTLLEEAKNDISPLIRETAAAILDGQ